MSLKKAFADVGEGIKDVFRGPSSSDNVFQLNGRVPLKRALPFGLQHVFAMFAANITPLLIVFGFLGLNSSNNSLAVNAMLAALLMAGLGTMFQLFFGARLPIVIGTSFTYVPIFFTIASSVMNSGGTAETAYYTILGSCIVGGLSLAFLALFYKFWGWLLKPLVPAIVVLGIGLSLLSSGAMNFFGGSSVLAAVDANGMVGIVPFFAYVLVALATMIAAICWSIFIPGIYKHLNIMAGILFGFMAACCIPGMVNFSALEITSFTGLHGVVGSPSFIDFSKLRFEAVPCLMTFLCFLASSVEGIGDASSLAKIGVGRNPTNRELTGCLVTDGLNSALGACFGSFPQTTYAENVGLVAQTKIVNRFTIFCGACVLVLASFFPPIANFIYTIPSCVIGGAMVILFGSIVVIGMKMVAELGWTEKNILIVSVCCCLGFGMSLAEPLVSNSVIVNGVISQGVFDRMNLPYLAGVFGNCVINMFVLAFVLSWVLPEGMTFHGFGKKKK
jgi:NCS2 family nucleobase:cation symporter-2